MLVDEESITEDEGSAVPDFDVRADAAPGSMGPGRGGWRRRAGAGTAAVLVAGAVFAAGMWFTNHLNADDNKTPAVDSPSAKAANNAPTGFTDYKGLMSGVTLAYPASWTLTSDTADQIVLGIEGDTGVSVRRETLESPVDTSNMKDIRAVTDAILSSPAAKLETVTTDVVNIHGLPGIFYLYYYGTGSTRGVHAHYFLFKGNQMYSLVFQVTPADQFQKYAGTFDQVLETFKTS